jgi:hypothetical protein
MEGNIQGAMQKAKEIALLMLRAGDPIERILQFTQLSEEEITRLKEFRH